MENGLCWVQQPTWRSHNFSFAPSVLHRAAEVKVVNPGKKKSGFSQSHRPQTDTWSTQRHSQQIPLPASTTKAGIARCTPAAPRIAQFDVVWKLWQHQPLWQALFETTGLALCYQDKLFLCQKDLLKMPREMPACILQFLSHWGIFQKSSTLRVVIHTTYLEKCNQYNWIFSNILVVVFSAFSNYFTIIYYKWLRGCKGPKKPLKKTMVKHQPYIEERNAAKQTWKHAWIF